jgi:glutathione S-transferase
MITLYHGPRACSLAALSLLHHLQMPFRLKVMDLQKNDQRRPDFLALNPRGQVPVLVDGDFVLTQLGAILGYITRLDTGAGLPKLSSREVAEQERWMYYFASVLHIQFAHFWRPERFDDDSLSHASLRATSLVRLTQSFKELDASVGTKTWLLGDKLSLADFNFFPMVSWLPRVLPQGLTAYPKLEAYLERLLVMPAVQRALADGGVDRQYLLGAPR